jgi:MFS family permease
MIGTAATAVSFAVLAMAHSEPWQVVAGVTLLGLGIGMSFASMANIIVEAVPQTQTGEATGMNTIMRTIGGAFGAQLAAVIVSEHVAAGSAFPSESGFTTAFAVGAVALGLALAAAAGIPGRPRRAPVGVSGQPSEARAGG